MIDSIAEKTRYLDASAPSAQQALKVHSKVRPA